MHACSLLTWHRTHTRLAVDPKLQFRFGGVFGQKTNQHSTPPPFPLLAKPKMCVVAYFFCSFARHRLTNSKEAVLSFFLKKDQVLRRVSRLESCKNIWHKFFRLFDFFGRSWVHSIAVHLAQTSRLDSCLFNRKRAFEFTLTKTNQKVSATANVLIYSSCLKRKTCFLYNFKRKTAVLPQIQLSLVGKIGSTPFCELFLLTFTSHSATKSLLSFHTHFSGWINQWKIRFSREPNLS